VAIVLTIIGVVVFFGVIVLATSIRVLREYERGVIFRLGRLIAQKGPGLIFLIPIIDRMVRVDLRTVTFDIPPQDLITRDNVPAKVNAVTYFRVVDPIKSVIEVERYRAATSQIAQTTLRSVLGKADLDMLLSERERLNEALQQIIDEQTDPWGIKVTTVEIKDVGIPQGMQRAMARQAEAERERRAKVINAEGEFQASERLLDAAQIMSENPASLQLRYLQTLLELGSSQASTIVFPLPIDLLRPLIEASTPSESRARRAPSGEADDASERTLEAANGAREIAGGESGHETRAELDAEVEAELADQARRVQAEVDRVQAEIAEKRKP
jgi:regulator of protease activity HflC (stomatin/prohibitin superfamily)